MMADYPGRLFVFEGLDGAGKSTQIGLLEEALRGQGYAVDCLAWRSPSAVVDMDGNERKEALGNNTAFCLLYAADLAEKCQDVIVPALLAGHIVLCDRYIYTAFARDVARGVDRQWVRQVYQYFAVTPDVAFYCQVPLEVAMLRILNRAGRIGFYTAGMDMKLSKDPMKSFARFQSRVMAEYDAMVQEFGLVVVDATQDVDTLQAEIASMVMPLLAGVERMAVSSPGVL